MKRELCHSDRKAYGSSHDMIVKTGPNVLAVTEIDGAVHKNVVTPRIGPFYELFLGQANRADGLYARTVTRPLFRLYYVDGCDRPILYYYEEPYCSLLGGIPNPSAAFISCRMTGRWRSIQPRR